MFSFLKFPWEYIQCEKLLGHFLKLVCYSSCLIVYYTFSSVQSLSRVQLFVTPWISACQASLSITNSRSLLKLMSIESVMPSSHLILCRHLLLLPPIPPSTEGGYFVFSKNCKSSRKSSAGPHNHQSQWQTADWRKWTNSSVCKLFVLKKTAKW